VLRLSSVAADGRVRGAVNKHVEEERDLFA
jgi:hypothetical protein